MGQDLYSIGYLPDFKHARENIFSLLEFFENNSNLDQSELLEKMIEEKIAEFKAKLPKRGYISVVTYGSDTGEPELEQYVMPNLPFVIEVIDGH